MKKTRIGKDLIYYGEFNLNKAYAHKETFYHFWPNLTKEPKECVELMFAGIDLCRDHFVKVFTNEDNFNSQDEKRKVLYLSVINKMVTEAVEIEQFHIANGFSMFNLWLVCLIKGDDDTRKYMEKCFMELRNEHKL